MCVHVCICVHVCVRMHARMHAASRNAALTPLHLSAWHSSIAVSVGVAVMYRAALAC
jgi:hypothetical protein